VSSAPELTWYTQADKYECSPYVVSSEKRRSMWEKVKKLKIYSPGLVLSGETKLGSTSRYISIYFCLLFVFSSKSGAAGKTVHSTKEAIEKNV